MAKTPKQLVKKIKDAQKRVQQATGKKVLVRKQDAKPVLAPQSKAAQVRQRKDYLSLKDLRRETTPRTRQLMREGSVQVAYINKTKSGRAILCETVTHQPNGTITRWKQLIRNEDPFDAKFSNSEWIKAECTCLQFKFTHDWTLHQKNATDLKYSTDEPSLTRNPQQLLGVCKHLYRCIQEIIQKGW